MRLIDIENKIKELIKEDIHNEEIFELLKRLIYLFYKRSHLLNNEDEAESISLEFAEDLYMKLLRGEEIWSFIGYINRAKMGYIRKYNKNYRSELIDASDNYELRDSVLRMSSSGSIDYFDDFNNISINSFLDNSHKEIYNMLKRYSRYKENTTSFRNIYLSIILSIINGYEISIFLNLSEINYFHLMYNIIKEKLISRINFDFNSTDNPKGNTKVLMELLGGEGFSE